MKGKKVLIFQQRGWAINIGHFLAKKLQSEGCKLAAFTLKRTTHEFIVNQKEVTYDLTISNDEIESRPKEYLGEDSYTLAEIEEALGVESIWPIVMSLRNHVRSYKDKFYYGSKQNVSDGGIIDYVMAVYKCIKFIFEQFSPDLIISPVFVGFPHIMFNLYAKKKGVTMLGTADSKISGMSLFSHDYLEDSGVFWNRVDLLNAGNEKSQNQERAKKYIAEFRKNFKYPTFIKKEPPKTLLQKIRHFGSPYYHILRWYIKRPINELKSTGITIDFRPPRIILRDHYCKDRYTKFMNNFEYYPLNKIRKFVYFPLQVQPEASTDVSAPYFTNQMETARQIAMSLPDDYTLVVKEHPTMLGYQSPSYIEKLARTVNVKLIDYKISTEEVLKRCDLVISLSSTTLAEAAFLNKPAIQLSNLGITLKLPNIFKHTDMTTLTAKIKEVLKKDLSGKEYERRLENYVSAVYDTGFDVNYSKIWERGGTPEEIAALWQAYKKEISKI
ncbi:MAG: hypothetical protein V1896_00995 [Candidatus Zambryskibacteria bacterium]